MTQNTKCSRLFSSIQFVLVWQLLAAGFSGQQIFAQQANDHYVPAEKNLSQEWLAALQSRGERTIYRGEDLFTIGMPCGGVGAGQLYVRGDGTLARWWIANNAVNTTFIKQNPGTGYRTYHPPSLVTQGFAVSATPSGGEALVLPLRQDKFPDELWPRIKQSTLYLMERDGRYGEVDGVLEGLQHLTDSLAWGPNTFTGSLYLAALRAAEEMAIRQGDEEFAAECRRLFESGRTWTLDNLWNGEYFIHKYSPAPKGGLPRDDRGRSFGDGCLSDQMFGQNWAHQLGLGYLYPPKRVRQSLSSVFKYNWAPDVGEVYKVRGKRFILLANPGESGLMGCTFPKGALKNMIHQNEDPWTGYEYQSASGMLWESLLDEGLSIAYGVHQRYQPSKHNPWNEIEGGDHYSRSIASWGMLLAASGYEYDGPAGKTGFAPKLTPNDFRSFFTAAEGWGTLAQQRAKGSQTNRIEVRHGTLRISTIKLNMPVGSKVQLTSVRTAGRSVEHAFDEENNYITLKLDDQVRIESGETVEIVLELQ